MRCGWLPTIELVHAEHQLPDEKSRLFRTSNATVHASQNGMQRVAFRIVPVAFGWVIGAALVYNKTLFVAVAARKESIVLARMPVAALANGTVTRAGASME